MVKSQRASLTLSAIEDGLRGEDEMDLLNNFAARALASGLPLSRAIIVVDTLHPIYEGRVFRWRRDGLDVPSMMSYGPVELDDAASRSWRQSPFYHLIETGGSILRRRLDLGDTLEFSLLEDYRADGQTEYLAFVHRFDESHTIGEMDCVYSGWSTDMPGGFTDMQFEAMCSAAQALALAIKSASLARIAETLVETYLGRDAGRMVLAGRIARGVPDRIFAALWFSDLRGFTRITDSAPPEEVIPLLNDYAQAIISGVHEAGGDVLKLVGDGILAIFRHEDPAEACRCALVAEATARERIDALNSARQADGRPWTQAYLGLHVGEVFYGNIGSEERLDFTVIGPAVNEVSRIATMCRSAERNTLVSSAFAAAALPEDRARLVSVGRYALRGVERPQDLFTIDPGA
ncbi:adenylate/guanylate cyclase domain-containing protein [Marinivivus vitaminiproducens]|uniref:adenylate/guanylate cyclase domain-containing protein n=1 Tax=Marinivivus vitaminiproducens TaxID=3035935 RepID=UPI00279804C8|nr:adenylate/guanylate cyclase domain-containing protein [Geminicoccaceae bacterium SCSIO 64248]